MYWGNLFWGAQKFWGKKKDRISSYWVSFSQADEVRQLVIRKGF